jgi:hypothetical protein
MILVPFSGEIRKRCENPPPTRLLKQVYAPQSAAEGTSNSDVLSESVRDSDVGKVRVIWPLPAQSRQLRSLSNLETKQ